MKRKPRSLESGQFSSMVRTALFAFLTARPTDGTRAVEYMLAWMMLGWGLVVGWWPGDVMVGPTFATLIGIMSEQSWANVAVTVGTLRLVALIVNGSWRRTPLLRFVGAACGMLWWSLLGALYWGSVINGATAFPNLAIYPIAVFFEGYSCYRCGHDANVQKSIGAKRTTSMLESGGHG